MKEQESNQQGKESSGMESALDGPALTASPGQSQAPPPFQLKAESASKDMGSPESSGTAAAPIQRYGDASDTVGNVSAGTNRGRHLNDESNRRIYERIAELEGRNASEAGEEYAAMNDADKRTALRAAIVRFQQSPQGQALISQISADNDVQSGGQNFYDRPRRGARSSFTAPRARSHEGEVENNDVTMQALANAWPRNILGRIMEEEDAYNLISSLVRSRGLPFSEASVNVISVRAFQGGEIHDNREGSRSGPFNRNNVYNDTTYILSKRDDVKRVTESRSTVDPGDATSAAKRRSVFRMEADQQWEYSGNSRGRTAKFDRPMYGLADRTAVSRGTYWEDNPEALAQALERGHSGARVVSDRNGRNFADVNSAGEANRVSAIHSGGSGGGTGDRVFGDSTGCSVVHGAWFPHFNESLRRASGEDGNLSFTYSLLDLRLFDPDELQQLVESA